MQLTDMMQKIAAHQGHVDRVAPIAGAEFTPQLDHLRRIIVGRDSRIGLLQPPVKGIFGAVYGRHTGPERIIEVKRNNGNLIEHGGRFHASQAQILNVLSRL